MPISDKTKPMIETSKIIFLNLTTKELIEVVKPEE